MHLLLGTIKLLPACSLCFVFTVCHVTARPTGPLNKCLHHHHCSILLLHIALSCAADQAPFVILHEATCSNMCLQIYVEIERARLTRKLAQLKEADGNIAEAADVLQEVAVVWCILLLHCCTSPTA